MKAELLTRKKDFLTFKKVGSDVYKGNKHYRGTGSSIEKLLLKSSGAFSKHATIKTFVVRDQNNLVARFALIHDQYLADYIQVSFFEAYEGLGDIFSIIKKCAKLHFPELNKIVVGLNGHLNYGAGILLNRFDETPLFGLPYNHDYYADYFKDLTPRKMVSYKFSMEVYSQWAESYKSFRKIDGLSVRFINKKNIKRESAIYTELNNKAFKEHPYWASRDPEEDLELFAPFRHLLNKENLIFAEVNGEPVGFFLWYPDFNDLISSQRDLNIFDVLKYRINPSIDTFRFAEIGIIPKYQGSPVALALIDKGLTAMKGYNYFEVGFIFKENKASLAFVKRVYQRCYGKEPKPYREFAVFETAI